ncbi:MAG: outer membrane protein assembly factor BamB [Gammaproteobacteria bacterium]|nr:outer membrane protein assembly factor BamB [Gammaproteobacteria bacterium]MDP7152811.1 outer membrane protein assembly factor BamB [Gammaproteobacteria bacterium]MDP7297055.1 outer membrane protein assembly factor BamB [Gammaproteobacteria bacterium]MDP7419643.1 outer membrane protein assembly factor BamB [Gammaproteobacteria bacterium]MDP7660687.1 outer membrane protein assembly factor BamB [Gammaproteobacteria bacterium]
MTYLVAGHIAGCRWVSGALMVLVCMFTLNGCGMFGGDEDISAPAELVKFKPTLRIKKAWSKNIGDSAENLRLALVVASDGTKVFAAAHDGRVAAFAADNGKRHWLKKTRLPLSGGPAIAGDVVVVGSSNGDLIALGAADGREHWRTTVSSEVLAAPALTSDIVLVRTVDGKLVALDINDGSEIWFIQQSVPRLTVRGTGEPVVVGDTVICGFDNGKLAAYNLLDGSVLWDVFLSPPRGRTEVDRLSDINASIRVVGDDVYVVSYQGALSALAVESGQVLWTREISSHSGIGVDFNNLYVSRDDSNLIALTRRAGHELWRQDSLSFRDISAPTPFGSSVVVGDHDGYLHWFDAATGVLQDRVRTGGERITTAPLVVNETLFVVTDGGKLFAFRDRTPKDES